MTIFSLDTDHLVHFGRYGYVIIPNVVSRGIVRTILEYAIANENLSKTPSLGPQSIWLNDIDVSHPLLSPFLKTSALNLALSLINPHEFEFPLSVQLSSNVPPWSPPNLAPHIDGLTSRPENIRPGTFTILAAILLSNQELCDSGNLWVWPGSHKANASFINIHGSEKLISTAPHPPVQLSEPVQIIGQPGDLLLAHYLLGHQSGRNLSDNIRYALYLRLRTKSHKAHWQKCISNAFFEFPRVREALKSINAVTFSAQCFNSTAFPDGTRGEPS